MQQNKVKPSNQIITFTDILFFSKYLFCMFLIIVAFLEYKEKSYYSGSVLLITGFIFLPIISTYLKQRIPLFNNYILRRTLFLVLILSVMILNSRF